MRRSAFISIIVLLFVSCQNETETVFDIDSKELLIGPEGGVRTLHVSASESWIATTESEWIAFSPANGKGSEECLVMVDSTLHTTGREGVVTIRTITGEKTFHVSQEGFENQIVLDEPNVVVENFADFDSRYFDVKVSTNVRFDVVIPEESKAWLSYKEPEFNLDRKARPRNVTIRFQWKINTRPQDRKVDVSFVPVGDVVMGRNDVLSISQKGALPIPENTVAGDSLALIAINRALGCWSEYDTSEPMKNWSGVQVYRSGKNKGRVRSAEFIFFETEEGLPYEVRYLTEAKELHFYSNVNSTRKNLSLGEDICTLTKLERLTVGAYGLTELPESFGELDNLRYLDLSSNNFAQVPKVLQKCESLTALFIHANQRNAISDLSMTNKKNYGGLADECPADGTGKRKFPLWLLKWNQLDTLRLSVNFLQGELPSDEELINEGFDVWKTDDVRIKDSLAKGETFFDRNDVPMVLPDTDFLAINHNRLHGRIPNWLMFHPKLDQWYPLLLVFPQEGKTVEGVSAGFADEPTNLNYYYELYKNKVNSSYNTAE